MFYQTLMHVDVEILSGLIGVLRSLLT